MMEDSPMSWLFRDAPVNAIWEGSGNIQCLDVLRALQKSPEAVQAYVAEVEDAREYGARVLVDRMALALQAALLVRHAPTFVSDAFCRSRLGGCQPYGTLPAGAECAKILERALPI